jgi:hypothetical protein
MMVAPAWAQVFIPDLSGSGSINIPAGGLTVVGRNLLGTQQPSSSFSGTIDIDPTGVLAKAGSGTFTIDGATITGGQFHVLDGEVAQSSGDSTSVTFLSVGSSTNPFTIAPSVGALDVSGGTITFGTTVQVGDFGGIGTVNQTGGNVVLGGSGIPVSLNIGNQGGNGTYNLSGGALLFDGSAPPASSLSAATAPAPALPPKCRALAF